MKQTIYLFVLLMLAAGASAQSVKYSISGIVIDDKQQPVPFATVLIIKSDSTQVAGGSSNSDDGRFTLVSPPGDYILVVQCIGYWRYESQLKIGSDMELPAIALKTDAVQIEDVVVTTQFITREADRFVLNVSGSTQAIGRTADEMLKLAPGVWLTEDKLSINGRSGVLVMVNERLLNMDFESMMAYLRNIKAEDIQRIEVIPVSGADYDASSKAGIIKITLRKQREDGLEGSLSLAYTQSANNVINGLGPSANVNYRTGVLSLYSNLSYSDYSSGQDLAENTIYDNDEGTVSSGTEIRNNVHNYFGRVGAIWDFKNNQSLGAELNYTHKDIYAKMNGLSQFNTVYDNSTDRFKFPNDDSEYNLSATTNYIWRIDSLGSVFKVIGDFYQRKGTSEGDFLNEAYDGGAFVPDSVYRNDMGMDYRVYSLSLAFEKVVSPVTVLKAGGKYNFNDMWDNTMYEYEDIPSHIWYPLPEQSGTNKYTEHISALYGIVNTHLFKKMSLSAGLRAEYTYAVPEAAIGEGSFINNGFDLYDAKQNYLKLFPDMNISLPLNEKQSTQIIFSYARKIERPPFWVLNPFMVPLSRYSYVMGNPKLRPTLIDDVSFTGVIGYRYSLTAGVTLTHDGISQVGFLDPENPDIFIYQHQNIDRMINWYANLDIPLTLTKWWDLTASATAIRLGNNYAGVERYSNGITTKVNTTVRLPASFALEVNGWTQSGGLVMGNMKVGAEYGVDASLKKRFMDNRITASLNILNLAKSNDQNVKLTGEGFTKYTVVTRRWTRYGFTLRYNFNSGQSFKARKVESDSADESSRLRK